MWKRLTLLVVSVLVAWVVLEVGLRQFGARVDPAARNEWIGCVGWAGQPHQVQKYFTDEFTTTERINSAGLPDVEHTYAKPPNVFRILLVGDSFIEGYQVDLEESFPRLLEAQLNAGRTADTPIFEVIKAGYRAWGTDQAWQYYLCEGYRYQPDLVIYAFTANDVMDNSLQLKAQMANWDPESPPKPYYTLDDDGQLIVHNFPYPPAPLEMPSRSPRDVLYKHLVSYRIAEKGWQSLHLRLMQQQRAELPATEVNRYSRHVIHYTMPAYLEDSPPAYDTAWRLTEALVSAFAADVAEHGAQFAIFSNGLPWSVEPAMQRELVIDDPFFDGWRLDWDYPDRRLAEEAEGLSVPFLALAPGFRDAADVLAEGESYFFREGHYNRQGHRLATELLNDWLVGEGLVQQASAAGD